MTAAKADGGYAARRTARNRCPDGAGGAIRTSIYSVTQMAAPRVPEFDPCRAAYPGSARSQPDRLPPAVRLSARRLPGRGRVLRQPPHLFRSGARHGLRWRLAAGAGFPADAIAEQTGVRDPQENPV